MLQVFWVEFQIAVVSSFKPQWLILLFAKLPELLPMREIHNFVFCSLQEPVGKLHFITQFFASSVS
jgi:hypothetical protein